VKKLGSGGFGQVSLFRHKYSNQLVAIKKIDLKSLVSPEDISRVFNEIGTLRELRHPNIVQLFDFFELTDSFCFVMEYCSGGDLRNYLATRGPVGSEKLFGIALQIVNGIRFCHNSNVVHRDLKLENLMFVDQRCEKIKIVDFGISGMFSQGSGDKTDCGSLLYMPPEYYKEHFNTAHPAQDIWALGCIFYYLLCGKHPFRDETRKEIIKRITDVRFEPLPSSVPRLWHKLIGGMLRQKPHKRWDMVKIQEYLEKMNDNPQAQLSDDSIEEVKVDRKCEKTLTTGKSMNSLMVPRVSVHNSVSPRANRKNVPGFEIRAGKGASGNNSKASSKK
jgi:serine/threonine protein kinase